MSKGKNCGINSDANRCVTTRASLIGATLSTALLATAPMRAGARVVYLSDTSPLQAQLLNV